MSLITQVRLENWNIHPREILFSRIGLLELRKIIENWLRGKSILIFHLLKRPCWASFFLNLILKNLNN